MKIKDLQRDEKPREKMIEKGCDALTDVELLAIILRCGGKNCAALDLARKLINKFSGLQNLILAETEQLIEVRDIGLAKATSIKALGEITKRVTNPKVRLGKAITNPQDIYEFIKSEFAGKCEEHLFLLSFDGKRRVISKDLISKGTLNETLIHPREVFKKALAKNASSIALAHNHPSEDLTPSQEDIKVTKKISSTGLEIGVPLMDHLIVTNRGFLSMRVGKLLI